MKGSRDLVVEYWDPPYFGDGWR